MVFQNGSQLEGYFHDGHIVGRGRLVVHNGDVYEGEFKEGKYEGQGVYKFSDYHPFTGFYKGEFKDD
jgi:hypothetical protein